MSSGESMSNERRISALAQLIREQLGEHNVLDGLVRELASSRVMIEGLTARLEQSDRELTAVKLAQRARDILLPQAVPAYGGRKEAQVDVSAPLPADRGFHALERDGNGIPFRWTGPSAHFFYDLHLDRSGFMMISLHVPTWGADHAENLTCTSDGVTIPLQRRVVGRTLMLEGALPPRPSLGLSRICFQVEKTHSVSQQNDTSPARELGIPVLRLKVSTIDDAQYAEWAQSMEVASPSAQAAEPEKRPTPAASRTPSAAAFSEADVARSL
jgi:hypothetical protein